MRKEYLDYLYDERSKIQLEIDSLVEKDKGDKTEGWNSNFCPIRAELKAKRLHIHFTNKAIDAYLQLHD